MIALGSDHRGYKLKEEIIKYLGEKEIEFKDFGTYSEERTDYPKIASEVSKAVQNGKCDVGVLICGTGFGMTMVANKYKGIRCADCYSEETAKYAKAHSNVNILALPADYINTSKAIAIIRMWLGTEFLGGRYQERLKMIEEIENENMK